jgi:hypothetical protein
VAGAGLPAVSRVYQYVPYASASEPPRLKDQLPEGHLLHVDWTPSTTRRGVLSGEDAERVVVWIRDVPSGERALIRTAMQNTALPGLVEWLREAHAAPEGWKILRHRHAWIWVEATFYDEELNFRVL